MNVLFSISAISTVFERTLTCIGYNKNAYAQKYINQ